MTCSYSKEFSSSAFTNVENAFITEYLPAAPGDAVRVYLYGLFLCQNPSKDQSISDIAKALSLTESQVKESFYCWDELGLVTVVSRDPFTVHYLPVRHAYSSKPRKYKAEKYSEFTKGVQALIPSRMISTGEYTEYFSIMETYSIKPEAMLMIIKYCVDLKGSSIGYRYVSKVAKDFGNRGLITVEKVENELTSYVVKSAELERILKALGIKRRPEHEDTVMLKKWTEELHFELESIIFAASKLKKGSMEKLDSFLLELFAIKSFTPSEIIEFINNRQKVYDLTIKINKSLSIYVEVIETEIENYVNKWLSFGFEEDALLSVATRCFKEGKNTLADMDEKIEMLRARGLISLSSIADYFESIRKTDEFIKKFLLTVGLNRRPNPWDRENLSVWKTWNFTEEMILEAGKLSAGKSNPIAYVNAILGNWKNSGIFSTDALSEVSITKSDNSQEAYNSEYERRRSLAHSRAQKNTEKAMSLEGFSTVYGRLNSIERDLAFAEIAGNETALGELEKEKATLLEKANAILGSISLALDDLSPRYACEKCQDTGYVGTHRCDCYEKEVK